MPLPAVICTNTSAHRHVWTFGRAGRHPSTLRRPSEGSWEPWDVAKRAMGGPPRRGSQEYNMVGILVLHQLTGIYCDSADRQPVEQHQCPGHADRGGQGVVVQAAAQLLPAFVLSDSAREPEQDRQQQHPVMIHTQAAHAQRSSRRCIEFSGPHRFSRARRKDITPGGFNRTRTRLGVDFDARPGKQPNPDVDGPLGRSEDLVQQDQGHARNPDKGQEKSQHEQPTLPTGQSSHHASSFDRLGVRISPRRGGPALRPRIHNTRPSEALRCFEWVT